jgi:hypothetical protein
VEALAATGGRRFRAMYLTTFTTVAGLLPLMLETSFQAQFLIPMAVSIAFGLAFATTMTLTGLPALLGILNDFRCFVIWIRTGVWPTRESAEPDTPPPAPNHLPPDLVSPNVPATQTVDTFDSR